MKISDIKPNPDNPRVIKDDKFKKLVKSIDEFPKMMELRPIVVDSDNVVLGGNMRLRALQHLGFKEVPDVWVKQADELTEDEKKRFIISDNASFGEWDWDTLANEWETDELSEWGVDVPSWESQNYSDKNKEIDIDEMESDMTIKLKYIEEEYHKVKEQLLKIASTPEQAVWKLLGNE